MPNLSLVSQTIATSNNITNAVYHDGKWRCLVKISSIVYVYTSSDLSTWASEGGFSSTSGMFGLVDRQLVVSGDRYVYGSTSGAVMHASVASPSSWTTEVHGSALMRVRNEGGLLFIFDSSGMKVGKDIFSLQSVARPAWDVCFGGGVFACVGSDGVIYSSSDGMSWTSVVTAPGSAFAGMAYGDGNWMIATGSEVYRSSDLSTWSLVFSSGESIGVVAFGGGLWVLMGSYGLLMSSIDGGDTWETESGSPVSGGSSPTGSMYSPVWGWLICASNAIKKTTVKSAVHNRVFSGVTRDSNNAFASRRVSLLRQDHSLIASTMSCSADGSWSIKSSYPGETLVLISGEPSKSAISFDHVSPPPPT